MCVRARQVERNLEFVRKRPLPMSLKLLFMALMSTMWKWAYYSPNTYHQLKIAEHTKRHGKPPDSIDPNAALTLGKLLLRPSLRGGLFGVRDFLLECFLPVLLVRFVLLPAPLLLLASKRRKRVTTPSRWWRIATSLVPLSPG